MEDENILDADIKPKIINEYFDTIQWWEKKRLIFNLIVVGTELLMLAYFWNFTKLFGVFNAIGWSIAYTLAANFFFSMGWGLEIFVEYYFKSFFSLKKLRLIIFILGSLISIFITIGMYEETFYNMIVYH